MIDHFRGHLDVEAGWDANDVGIGPFSRCTQERLDRVELRNSEFGRKNLTGWERVDEGYERTSRG